MTTRIPSIRPNAFSSVLAKMIALGGERFTPETIGCHRATWNQLVAEFRLVAVHPFARPTYWEPNANGFSRQYADALAKKARRKAGRPRSTDPYLDRKLRSAHKAGLIP